MHTPDSAIVLCTLNAKYIHASLGLRYLQANMGDLAPQTALREFTIARKPQELAAELLALQPRVIGFGVYIWNVVETTALIRLLKAARPDIRIVLGGPEVSHEWADRRSCNCPTTSSPVGATSAFPGYAARCCAGHSH